MNSYFTRKVITILQEYCDREYGGNVRATSKALGVDPDTGLLHRWLKCLDPEAKLKRFPRLDILGPCMDSVGVRVVPPWEMTDPEQSRPFPVLSGEKENPVEEINSLRSQVTQLRTERDKALGQVELLKEQLASAQKAAIKNCVTQTANGGMNKAVIGTENINK